MSFLDIMTKISRAKKNPSGFIFFLNVISPHWSAHEMLTGPVAILQLNDKINIQEMSERGDERVQFTLLATVRTTDCLHLNFFLYYSNKPHSCISHCCAILYYLQQKTTLNDKALYLNLAMFHETPKDMSEKQIYLDE